VRAGLRRSIGECNSQTRAFQISKEGDGPVHRRVVEEKFTLERMAQAYHALYQTVAGESPDPNRLCSRNLP
jgi:hypothetical protein